MMIPGTCWNGTIIAANHLSLGMLFEIVRQNPQVFEKLGSPIIAEPTHVKIAA